MNTQTTAPPKNRATQYSTWKQSGYPTAYILVLSVSIKDGQIEKYELLNLFKTEKTEVTAQQMSDLITTQKLTEWAL